MRVPAKACHFAPYPVASRASPWKVFRGLKSHGGSGIAPVVRGVWVTLDSPLVPNLPSGS